MNLRTKDRPGHVRHEIVVPAFDDKKLYPYIVLYVYLKRTDEFRGEITSLFITLSPLLKKISPQTISHWVSKTIQICCSNLDNVKAHST